MNQRAKLSGQFFAKLFRDISVTEGNRPAYAKILDFRHLFFVKA